MVTDVITFARATASMPASLDIVNCELQASAEWLGLHSSVVRAIPTFAVYLATLMHVYHLGRQQVGTPVMQKVKQ